ncbi:MAG TPA: sigma-54-dependent Fis family transcriptional regulator [Anaeromyxobacteraceae bacterium]|nr:sigma-54-dependent Fis family transcriptional regulator [Anaeromyxobacteraceae bacterium]
MAIPITEAFARPDLDANVSLAWSRALRGDDVAPGALRPVIAQSWLRCRDGEVDPALPGALGDLDAAALRAQRDLNRTLVDASAPVMAAAHDFLSDSGSILLLTDAHGLILGVEGDCSTVDRAGDIRLVPGVRWDELAAGTNAIGTALAIGQAVQVHASEHYREAVQSWTCSAAVVRDPCDGAVLGAIDVSGAPRSFSRQSLAFVVSAAAQIEGHLKQLELAERFRILAACVAPLSAAHAEPVILFDRRGLAVKANGRAAAALDRLGLAVAAGRGLRVEALNLEARGAVASVPGWLRAGRAEPVMEHGERIGTMVVLPEDAARRARPAPRTAERGAEAGADPFAAVVGPSAPLREAVERARTLAASRAPVLLHGETGVGKELFARGIHAAGRARGPFVAVNCAGLSRELLASELFGYADGAFTGARRGGMEGKVEAAAGGTLFLDEIGEMALELQGHLLRVLESGEIYRVGESRPRRVDFRLVSATNREPRDEVAAGRFRMDLYYRVAVTSIRVPPLRSRPEDVVPVAEHFLARIGRETGAPRALAGDALGALKSYGWPGNVRELRNVLESITLGEGRALVAWQDLPEEVRAAGLALPSPGAPGAGGLRGAEAEAIRAALLAERGNLTRAARRLGIAKSTLYAKVEAHGLADAVEQARRR